MNDNAKSPSVVQKELTEGVLARIKEYESNGGLTLPKDYSAANALKGAMIVLQETKDRNGKLAIEVCTKESIAMALLKMSVQGLSVLKGQGYFIPYGDQLTWIRSYQGSIALAKRVGNVRSVKAQVVYQEDDFVYSVDTQTGHKRIEKHNQKLENIDNSKILGAYALVTYIDGAIDVEIMTLQEIQTAWNQGQIKGKSGAHQNFTQEMCKKTVIKGKSGAHQNFTQEMCKKTVINRACKGPINSSSDSNLMGQGSEFKELEASDEVIQEVENDTASEEVEFEEIEKDTQLDDEPFYMKEI